MASLLRTQRHNKLFSNPQRGKGLFIPFSAGAPLSRWFQTLQLYPKGGDRPSPLVGGNEPFHSYKLDENFRIRTQILHPYVHKLGREYYGYLALSGKVIRTPKIRFQILTSHSETNTGLTFDGLVRAS
ncbi:hypothetical protein TNCV_1930991 [Trichonephila clavipes]|nr:hypothetical protein TNCV_1930991 [Trichonephila clavipes]